jgi:hypothetical protein
LGFNIQKAVRERVYTKIALMGTSGSGKTYSALRLATGMAAELSAITKKKATILMANTEMSRGRYYANEFDYDIVDIEPPHNPERYVELIGFAITQGYDILIIDSTSHEWEGIGGCLELQKIAGGTAQAWAKVTPRHNEFINAIAESKIHLIATMRAKDQYEIDKDDKGKTTIRKLGVGAKQRDGFEFEFTVTMLLDQATNTSESKKDNTHIFEGKAAHILTEEDGKKIIKWANSSNVEPVRSAPKPAPALAPVPATEEPKSDVAILIREIASIAAELPGLGVEKSIISDTIKNNLKLNGKASANYNKIPDVETAETVLAALEAVRAGALASDVADAE